MPDEALRTDIVVGQEGDRHRQSPEWGEVEDKLMELELEGPAEKVWEWLDFTKVPHTTAPMHDEAVEVEPLQEWYQTQEDRRATCFWQEEHDGHCSRQLQPL